MHSLSSILYGLYRGSPEHEVWVLACVEGMWPKIIGPRLARVCRPTELEGSRLIVDVVDPAWREIVQSMKDELVKRIRAATDNEVRQVSFR